MTLPIPNRSKLPQVIKELNALGVRVAEIEAKIVTQAAKNEFFDTRLDSITAELLEHQSHWADIHERITALEKKVRSLIPCPGAESDALLTPNEDSFLFQAIDDVDVDTDAQILSVTGEIVGTITAVSSVPWLTITPIDATSFSMVANPTGLGPETYFGLVTISGENVQTLIIPITFIVAPPISEPILTVIESSFDFDAIESGADPDDQTINIKNTGAGDLTGPSIAQVGGNELWLSFGAVTGAADDWQATISVSNTLPAGTYNKTIRITDPAAPGQFVDRVVTVNITVAGTLVLSVSPPTLDFEAVEGGSPASSQFIDIIATGSLDFAGPTVEEVGGDAAWLATNITMVDPKHYRCEVTLNTDAEAVGTLNKTLRFSDANQTNGPQDSVITVVISAATLDLSVSPSTLDFVALEGGSPASSQFIDIIGVGTQDFAGPTVLEVGGDATWLTTNITMVDPKHYRCEVTLNTDAELAGILSKTLRFSDANQTNGAQDSVVTVTISSSSSLAYPDLPFDKPVTMGFNTATNKPTGSPLSWRYSDNLVASWLDIDASLGSNAVVNMTTLQAQINADASGTPVRRGYEFASTRRFDGALVWPHNSATGTSGLRPIGYAYDKDLKIPPGTPRTAPTFVATVNNVTSAMATSFSGANDQNHGRIAVMGCDFTVATTLGQTFLNNYNAAIIDFGSPYADQSSASRRPNGFLLHDCRVVGYSAGWIRRGLGIHGENVEVRACWFDEIHSNPRGASGKDAQCIAGWNGTSKVEIRYSVLHGGDENIAWGGGAPRSNDQVVEDIWVDHCDLGKNATYLANWGHKNAYEPKCGHRQLITFCRAWGMDSANDNQGYAFTIKSGLYGSAPTEGTSNVHVHGCWVEKYPAFCATISREGTTTGLLARRLSFTDCFGWNLNIAPYNQANRRHVLASNDVEPFDEIYFSHCTFASTSSAIDSAVYGQMGSGTMPNFKFKDCILPYAGYGFWNSAGQGLTMLNNVAPGPTWEAARNTFCPKTGMPSNYPTVAPNDGWTAEASFAALGMVNQAAGNLRLDPSSLYYKGNAKAAPDGWNRGVTDPDMIYNELAETPIHP